MKLDRKKMLLISFMLFSLFFGAGNLIFPPFLGQNAGSSTVSAMLGFPRDGGDSASAGRHRCGAVRRAGAAGAGTLGTKFSLMFHRPHLPVDWAGAGHSAAPHPCRLRWRSRRTCRRAQHIRRCGWRPIRWCFFLVALWLCLNPGQAGRAALAIAHPGAAGSARAALRQLPVPRAETDVAAPQDGIPARPRSSRASPRATSTMDTDCRR